MTMKDIISNIVPKTTIDVMTNVTILGALLVSFGYPFLANVVWTISNPYLTWYNYNIKQFAQAKLFGVLTFIGLLGIYNLWPY